MSGGEIFGYGWREDHARAGDHAIDSADAILKMMARKGEWPVEQGMGIYAQASALAAIAQAHYAAANVRARPIRDVELPPKIVFSGDPEGSFTTGPYRAGGCSVARFDHASAPYGPQCELPTGHARDHVFPA